MQTQKSIKMTASNRLPANKQYIIQGHECDSQKAIAHFIKDERLANLMKIKEKYNLDTLSSLLKSLENSLEEKALTSLQWHPIEKMDHVLKLAAIELYQLEKISPEMPEIGADIDYLQKLAKDIKPIISKTHDIDAKRYK